MLCRDLVFYFNLITLVYKPELIPYKDLPNETASLLNLRLQSWSSCQSASLENKILLKLLLYETKLIPGLPIKPFSSLWCIVLRTVFSFYFLLMQRYFRCAYWHKTLKFPLKLTLGLFANPSQIVGYWHNTDYQRNTDIIFSPVA